MEENLYKVKTEIFEGPLELLLNLIESRKLFINELSISQVSEDYINYIKNLPQKKIDEMTNFITIAATLILIKSRSLLPNLELTKDEENKIIDLEARLKKYKNIVDSTIMLRQIFGSRPIYIIEERKIKSTETYFLPDTRINPKNMLELVNEVLAKMPKAEVKLPEIEISKVATLEEMIDELQKRVTQSLETNFKNFIHHNSVEFKDVKEHKIHVIVSFLAMLELVRTGIIDVIQNNDLGDIDIVKRNELEVNEKII